MHDTLVILGAGYTARFLLPLAARQYAHVVATSRDPDRRLRGMAPDRRICFDLSQPKTWQHIPRETDLLWCFPAAPLDLVKAFSATLDSASRRLVVLASTSAYKDGTVTGHPPAWIDETAPINLSKPRVRGEEFLRTECGAVLLRVAGIYGPGRNPLNWIKTGRVTPSRKYVNLIHVDDLAAICLAALERGTAGEAYNVSDGTPRTWNEIVNVAQARWGVPAAPEKDDAAPGKRIMTRKLLTELGIAIRHSDLYAEIEAL